MCRNCCSEQILILMDNTYILYDVVLPQLKGTNLCGISVRPLLEMN